MTDMFGKCRMLKWPAVFKQAFNIVKSLLWDCLTLRAPDLERRFVITVDTSRFGVGFCRVAGGTITG